jgi:hypothetical protein
MIDLTQVRCLTFGGVGFLGGLQIGCIKYFEEAGIINQIDTFVGSSSGSIVSLGVILGLSSHDMICVFKNMQLPELNCIDQVFETRGFDDGSFLFSMVQDILSYRAFPCNTTFADLRTRTGKDLVVNVVNLTDNILDSFSFDSHPDMEVRLAIRMSCALPIIFTPVTFEGKIYIDGCCYKGVHVPKHVEEKLRRGDCGKNLILRINNIMNIPDEKYGDDFISFIIRVANSFALFAYREMDNLLSHEVSACTTIIVDLNMEPGFVLEDIVTFDRNDVESLVARGYDTIRRNIAPLTTIEDSEGKVENDECDS